MTSGTVCEKKKAALWFAPTWLQTFSKHEGSRSPVARARRTERLLSICCLRR